MSKLIKITITTVIILVSIIGFLVIFLMRCGAQAAGNWAALVILVSYYSFRAMWKEKE